MSNVISLYAAPQLVQPRASETPRAQKENFSDEYCHFYFAPFLQSIEVHLRAPCLAAEVIAQSQDMSGFVAGS